MPRLPIRPMGATGIASEPPGEQPEWKKQAMLHQGFRDAELDRALAALAKAIEHQENLIYVRFMEKPLPKWHEGSVRRWPSGAHRAKEDDAALARLRSAYDALTGGHPRTRPRSRRTR